MRVWRLGPGVLTNPGRRREEVLAYDRWASKQEEQPTRSEAIRRLVELGLKVKSK